jgi:hypothetical protein
VSEVGIIVVTLFSLASEVSAKLFGHILWENVRGVDGQVTEIKHTQIHFLFGGSINLYSATRLLLPLTAGRIVFVCIGCCRVTLASITLFGLEVGRDAPSTREFFSSFLGPLACVLFQGLMV